MTTRWPTLWASWVLADYQGQGRLAPAWRWDLADASVYPRR